MHLKMDEMEEDDSFDAFQALEIDLDYEFDASRYFDFSRAESLSEVREAESWFESAGSYPPSPYMAKLIIPEDILTKNLDTLPKSKDVVLADAVASNSDIGMDPELPVQAENVRGWACYDHMTQDTPKAKTKPIMRRAPSSKGSTLMKPTASQLAKQNRPRFHKPLMQMSERTLQNPCGNENQAAKRQKLEDGNLRKVLVAKQQPDLVHKVPKKDGSIYNNSEHPRLRITIPREPELETAQRAQRMRPKNIEGMGENTCSTIPVFKARPLNRKILEAPSLLPRQKTNPRLPEFKEFHLKTSERAMQHISNASSSLPSCYNSDSEPQLEASRKVPNNYKSNSIIEFGAVDSRRLHHQIPLPTRPQTTEVINGQNCEGTKVVPKFRARTLNRKILSSKGDMGVFRTDKREVTIPMEFNFPTDKRLQNPPIELFSKVDGQMLSLTSELKQSNGSQFKLSRPMPTHVKGSKENMIYSLQEDDGITSMVKETRQKLGGKQIGHLSDGGMAENPFSSIFAEACGHPLTELR